jgi:hypothetical protein
VTIHPVAGAASQNGATDPAGDGALDRTTRGRRQRDQRDLVALAEDSQHTVAVHLLEGLDVGARRFENAQAEQTEHGHQSEVVDVGRLVRGREHGLELKVVEAERRGLRGDAWTANVDGERTPLASGREDRR